MISFFRKSIMAKLLLVFVSSLVVIAVFGTWYFISNQKKSTYNAVYDYVNVLSNSLQSSVGFALKNGNFDLIQFAFENTKKDSSITHIIIFDESSTELFKYSSDKKDFDINNFKNEAFNDDFIRIKREAKIDNKKYGEIIVQYSLKETNDLMFNDLMIGILIISILFVLSAAVTFFVTRKIINHIKSVNEIAKRISLGDLSVEIQHNQIDEVGQLLDSIEIMVKSILKMTDDVNELSNHAVNGNLSKRANCQSHQGEYKLIIQGFNKTLDAVIEPLNVTAEYVDRISKGDIPPKIEEEYKGDFNKIKNNLNNVIDVLNELIDDLSNQISSVEDGKLDYRINPEKFIGGWNILTSGINNINDAYHIPLIKLMNFLNKVSNGDELEKIDLNLFKGDFVNIFQNVNKLVDFLYGLISDQNSTAQKILDGETDARIDLSKYPGGWNSITAGFNNALDAVINPLNLAAEYVDRISKGDIPPRITDNYNGDFNEIKNNLNGCIEAVSALVSDTAMLAKAAKDGKLDTRANADKHKGDFREIVQGVNNTLDSVIGPLNVAAEYVDRISNGDIPPKITENYNGDFNEIKNNLNGCIDAINLLVSDGVLIAKAAVEGKLDTRANSDKHFGDFRVIIKGFNNTLDSVIGPLNVAAKYVDRISKGDIPPKITDTYNGDFNEIKNNLNQAIDAIVLLVSDAKLLAQTAKEGKLDRRANEGKHYGDYREIIMGLNATMDNVVAPINEAAEILGQMATGDLSVRMFGDYQGDLANLKNDINALGDSLSQLITQVNESVQNTASAALEISSTAEGLSASTQEQSAQAEEVASAVEEMSRTVIQNAKSATRTAEVAQQSGDVASEGAKIVKQTVTKMRDIAEVVKHSAQNIKKLGESSKQIGEIITVIDDIADQTNLLALNAAIEAARAGEQGRGFAVVADEVRKLAERTTEATKQIANMIKGIQSETEMAVVAMNQGTVEVQSGIEYADRAGESLNAILLSTQELLDMINQIAAASEQQSATSEQISKNVMSISKVTAESAQRVEEVAHTSEDLARLTEHLSNLMANFQVEDSGGYSSKHLASKPKRQLPGA